MLCPQALVPEPRLTCQVLNDYLGVEVVYVPYPDLTSFYVGLRNGNCDFAVGAVELDPQRAACPATCPDPSVALLPVLPEEDYVLNPVPYQLRLAQDICCLEYSSSYYMSGFALMSRLKRTRISVLEAIFSMEILNVAMPVLCGLISFGTIMWLLERRTNPAFKNQTAGVYYAFVSLSTFGLGDLAPATTPGRLLTIIWCACFPLRCSKYRLPIIRLTSSQSRPLTQDNLLCVLAHRVWRHHFVQVDGRAVERHNNRQPQSGYAW